MFRPGLDAVDALHHHRRGRLLLSVQQPDTVRDLRSQPVERGGMPQAQEAQCRPDPARNPARLSPRCRDTFDVTTWFLRQRMGSTLAGLAIFGAGGAARGRGDPCASAGARRRPQARRPPPARAHPLLPRRRRRRPGGRRPHDPVRHPRCRALPAGARAGAAQRIRMGAQAADHDRRPVGRDRPRPSRKPGSHAASAITPACCRSPH